jgi:hypothetical protein
VGGQPTIDFKGVNVQIENSTRDSYNRVVADGTGNLIIGRNANLGTSTQTGSHSVVIGDYQKYSGIHHLIAVPITRSPATAGPSSGSSTRPTAGRARSSAAARTSPPPTGPRARAASPTRPAARIAACSAESRTRRVGGGYSRRSTANNQVVDGSRYFVRQDVNGTKIADSGPTNGQEVESYYFPGSYRAFRFPGVDASKCSVTADAENDPSYNWQSYDVQTSIYVSGEYIYVLAHRLAFRNGTLQYDPISKVDVNLTMNCNNATT